MRPEPIAAQIGILKEELAELEKYLPDWDRCASNGAKKVRGVAHRIVLSSQTLKQLVKENTE